MKILLISFLAVLPVFCFCQTENEHLNKWIKGESDVKSATKKDTLTVDYILSPDKETDHTPASIQIGYSFSVLSPFNISGSIKRNFGIFYSINGFHGNVHEDYPYKNIYSIVIGPTFRVIKKYPFYISTGIGYGEKTELEKDKLPSFDKGFNYQIGVDYDFYSDWYLVGIEVYYNKYARLGVGISFGLVLNNK
jgi:hypothetical protein